MQMLSKRVSLQSNRAFMHTVVLSYIHGKACYLNIMKKTVPSILLWSFLWDIIEASFMRRHCFWVGRLAGLALVHCEGQMVVVDVLELPVGLLRIILGLMLEDSLLPYDPPSRQLAFKHAWLCSNDHRHTSPSLSLSGACVSHLAHLFRLTY